MNEETITIEEHRELGKILKQVRTKLMDKMISYKPKRIMSKSKETKALKHLDLFKCLMDDIMCRDYSNDYHKYEKINYGPIGDKNEKPQGDDKNEEAICK